MRDARAVAAELAETAGWRARGEGDVDRRLLAAWGLPAGATAREVAVGSPAGSEAGQLSLLQFSGVTQRPIRSNPQTWDVGGHLDLNVRVVDIDSSWQSLRARRWHATSDPVTWRFGDKLVREWLAIGPDGLAFALIERLAPPLDDPPAPGRFSRVFNSSQVVSDMPAALAFYTEALGFRSVVHLRKPLLDAAGENPLGMPHNLADRIEVEIAILNPQAEMEGSVELIRFHGLDGRDFGAHAHPPNLGILALRFPVRGLDAFVAHLASRGVSPVAGPLRCCGVGGSERDLIALRTPDGAWLEFFEDRSG